MRKSILTIAFVLGLSGTSFGQYKDYQLRLLKAIIGAPQETQMVKAESLKLPEDAPLKVYIATNTETKTRQNFIEWIDQWNQEDGKKYGAIEVVDNWRQASVILARYALQDPSPVRDEGLAASSANEPNEIDPATRKPVDNSVLTQKPLTSKFRVMIYEYVLLNSQDGLKIIRSLIDSVILKSTIAYTSVTPDSSSSTNRINERLNAGDLPKGQKDSKAPGDKFRDEFFKMIKARSAKK